MRFLEKVLLFFSRNPETGDYQCDFPDNGRDNTLGLLTETFPGFSKNITNKTILDFGCGLGLQAIALQKLGARLVVGFDTNPEAILKATYNAKVNGITERIKYKYQLEENDKDRYDIIISQNSMEHYKDPQRILTLMKKVLSKNGRIYITFGPPWFAPYGSHMHFFTRLPWVNLFFTEKTVMNVRKNFRQDGAEKYVDVKSGLNKMSIKKFEKIVASSDLKIIYIKYKCVKDLDFLGKVPVIRELFINRVNCIMGDLG